MKKRFVFLLCLILMLIGWFHATWSTRYAPMADGRVLYGFPFIFGSKGTVCMTGYCPGFISYPVLTIDLIFTVAIPALAQWLYTYIRKKRI